MSDVAIKIENLKKQYRLGTIGGGTLTADLQSWWARKRGKEDPNTLIGTNQEKIGEIFYALDGINLEVKKGEALGIIGANGAGKSTLLKLLSRVTAPTEGRICINGRITSMLEVGTGFHPELTGRENIYMNGAILGMTKAEIDAKIEDIIDFSECRQFIDTPVKRYSSGMYVKLAFSVAAHLDSEIMIMDEVLAVGDVKFQKKCLGKMGDAAYGDGKTVLYVSHNMSTIRQLCNRCIVMEHGKIVYDGDVESAIDLYAEQEKGELASRYDFENVKRPSPDHGSNLFVHSFEFLGIKEPVFKSKEEMKFRVDYSSKQDIDELRVYFTVNYIDSTPIGTVQSPAFDSIKSGERRQCDFSMIMPDFVDGDYYFYLDIFSMNEYGYRVSYDRPDKKIYFKILDNEIMESTVWPRRWWGSIRFEGLDAGQAEAIGDGLSEVKR